MRPNPEIPKLLMPEPPRRSRWWIPLLWVLALLLAGLLWCHGEAEAAECPSTAPGRIPGFGYTPPPGARSCWWTGWATPGAPPPQQRCQSMDLTAHPFGTGPGGNEDAEAFRRRYGGVRDTEGGHLSLDAETIYSKGQQYLSDLCCANVFGTAATHMCIVPQETQGRNRAIEELHDYWAVNFGGLPASGSGSGGRPLTVVPWIEEASSPAPGVVSVKWSAKPQDYFEVRVGETSKRVEKDLRAAVVELPPGVGGELAVTVATFRGTEGRSSLAKTVAVAPREAGPESPPQPPAEPVPPKPPEPEPPAPGCERCPACPPPAVCPACDPECPGKLASATQRAERAEAAQSQAEAALAALVAELAAVKADLKRLQDLPPIAVPPRIWETLQLQQELGRVQGAGMRQRAREVRAWICTEVAPAAPECRP